MTNTKEVWENTTPSTVWVTLTGPNGRERHTKIPGYKRVSVTTEDREAVEAISPGKSVFNTGRLRRIDNNASEDQKTAALTDDDLRAVVKLRITAFRTWVKEQPELNVRRLCAIMKDESLGDIRQLETINEAIKDRWPPIKLDSVNERDD